jgi:hypothetical protein
LSDFGTKVSNKQDTFMNPERHAAAMGLRDSGEAGEAAVEFGRMAGETDDPEWKSNLLLAEHGCYRVGS